MTEEAEDLIHQLYVKALKWFDSPVDFSEHVCFDYDCVRINGVEWHKPECPKSKPKTWRDKPSLL